MTLSDSAFASLTEQFDQILARAMNDTGLRPDTRAFYLEALTRTAHMKVATIRSAASAYGAQHTPASRSGAVKELVTQWAHNAREGQQ